MFALPPDIPPQYVPIVVAQNSHAAQQNSYTIGVCNPIENKPESKLSAINSVAPIGSAYRYLMNIEGRKIDPSIAKAAKITLKHAPAHGIFSPYGETKSFSYRSSDYQYFGPDNATFLVEIGGYKVNVIYHFVLIENAPGGSDQGEVTDDKDICPNGEMWKISSTK